MASMETLSNATTLQLPPLGRSSSRVNSASQEFQPFPSPPLNNNHVHGEEHDLHNRGEPQDLHTENCGLPEGEKAQPEDPAQLRMIAKSVSEIRAALGLKPHPPIIDEHNWAPHGRLLWPNIRSAIKEPCTEFCGVFIMMLIGQAGVAQVLLSKGDPTAAGGNGFGNFQTTNWVWGIGVMMGIYVAGDSGAYLNPATTITNCLLRELPWRRVPVYLVAQFSAAFLSTGLVYANYINEINAYEGGPHLRTVPPAPNATASVFATYPREGVNTWQQFLNEFIGSAVVIFCVFALKDDSNRGQFSASESWFPLTLFFLIFGITSSFSWNTGAALNMARDLGPRVMTYALGYEGVWSAGNYYFWVPIVAPLFGSIFGGVLYDLLIYTGPSPINTPWMGLAWLFHPRKAFKYRLERQRKAQLV